MSTPKLYDVAVIGGGIAGTATAMQLLQNKNLSLIIIEAEEKLARHQTGNNSGVVHSGLYYKPGSLKAKNCVEGRTLMYNFCKEHNIAHEQCGKLVVAVNENEIPFLDELEARGKANGLIGIKRLKEEEISEYEPHAAGIAGLYVPETGIVDYVQVTNAYAKIIKEHNGEIKTSSRFLRLNKDHQNFVLETTSGEVHCKFIVNCGGLYSDRIAKLCGVKPNLQIIPFRGEYYEIKPDKEHIVKNLIYPVPDPKFPFLGVHFTRMIHGGIEAGPNAVLAFKREGYTKRDISIQDLSQMFLYSGFWKMASKHYKMGVDEFTRSFSKKRFVKALQKLIPEIIEEDIHPGGAGVRAQALEPNGKLVDDFRIVEGEKMVHVLNAPSPAATASISIGRTIAELVRKRMS